MRPSGLYLINLQNHLCIRLVATRDGYVEPIQFGYVQRRLGTETGWNIHNVFVAIGVALCEHTRCSIACDVNPFTFGIESHIVVDADAGKTGNYFAGVGIENEKRRRIAGSDKQAMGWLIERHSILNVGVRHRPSRNQFPCRQIDDSNLIREIDVHFLSRTIDGHGLRSPAG